MGSTHPYHPSNHRMIFNGFEYKKQMSYTHSQHTYIQLNGYIRHWLNLMPCGILLLKQHNLCVMYLLSYVMYICEWVLFSVMDCLSSDDKTFSLISYASKRIITNYILFPAAFFHISFFPFFHTDMIYKRLTKQHGILNCASPKNCWIIKHVAYAHCLERMWF